jgi:hypothetical protein
MKGSLHTDELLGAVAPRGGCGSFRAGRRLSHAFWFDVPTFPGPSWRQLRGEHRASPDHQARHHQNAFDLARALVMTAPSRHRLGDRDDNPAIPTTVEAPEIHAMSRAADHRRPHRRPVRFDIAVSPHAARTGA